MLRAARSNEVKYDKQIITGMTNSDNPGKAEMHSRSKSVLFFLHQTYLPIAMAFCPFLHPHTDSPEENLNLTVNI